jgi:hypothetical protein
VSKTDLQRLLDRDAVGHAVALDRKGQTKRIDGHRPGE